MVEKKASAPKKSAPAPAAAAVQVMPAAKAAAPAAKPAPAPTPQAKPVATIKPASVVKPVSAGDRARMVAEAAFFIAEKRGFVPGRAEQDWAEAERQIAALLNRGG